MMTPMFVWLGSGRAARRKVGLAGQLLDRAAQAGLPVPPGAILLDEFFRLAIAERLVAIADCNRVTDVETEVLHKTLLHSVRLPRFYRSVSILPVCVSGVAIERGLFGRTEDYGPVDFYAGHDVARALASAWSAGMRQGDANRIDTFIVEIIPAQHAGVALCERASALDEVYQYSTSLARAPSGPHPHLSLPRLGRRARPAATLQPFAQRLQMLLRGLRHTLGDEGWRVHWADDGEICYVVHIDLLAAVDHPMSTHVGS